MMINVFGYSAEVMINRAILSYVATSLPKNYIFGVNVI